eukprot:SAG11_NODE_7491_length_1137_cov_1.502890_2_plen_107_part_00
MHPGLEICTLDAAQLSLCRLRLHFRCGHHLSTPATGRRAASATKSFPRREGETDRALGRLLDIGGANCECDALRRADGHGVRLTHAGHVSEDAACSQDPREPMQAS